MIKQFSAIAAATLIAGTVSAQTVQIKPLQSGAALEFVAESSMVVPNDLATLMFSATTECKDLPTAQSELNKTMAAGQAAIKDFSSLAEIKNYGYSTYPIYTNPKKGEAPKIVGWRASQTIQVKTEDIEGVAALVQTAQTANLALDNINYSLRPSTKEATQEKLIAGVIDSVNKKAANVALAMNVPVETFYLEKLNFNQGFEAAPRDFAVRTMMANKAEDTVQMPSFEAGTSNVSMSATASIKMVPDK